MIGVDIASFASACVLIVTIVLDLHNGYMARIPSSKISKGAILIILRIIMALATASFAYSLSESLVGGFTKNSLVSVALSVGAAASIISILLYKDKANSKILAIGVAEVKAELRQAFWEEHEKYLAGRKQEQDRLYTLWERFTKEATNRLSSVRSEKENLSAMVHSLMEEATSSAALMKDATKKFTEQFQTVDYVVEQLKAIRDALSKFEPKSQPEQSPSPKTLTTEDGKTNRLKGLDAQRELEDLLRSWGL